jgi:hypothetical protein
MSNSENVSCSVSSSVHCIHKRNDHEIPEQSQKLPQTIFSNYLSFLDSSFLFIPMQFFWRLLQQFSCDVRFCPESQVQGLAVLGLSSSSSLAGCQLSRVVVVTTKHSQPPPSSLLLLHFYSIDPIPGMRTKVSTKRRRDKWWCLP